MLVDNSGRLLAFEQVAVIPFDEKLYCILKPIDHIDNVAADEAIVFYVEEGEIPDEFKFTVEIDELKVIEVFEKYYNLLDEESKKRKNT